VGGHLGRDAHRPSGCREAAVGYRYERNNRRYEILEEEAETIRLTLQLYLEGC